MRLYAALKRDSIEFYDGIIPYRTCFVLFFDVLFSCRGKSNRPRHNSGALQTLVKCMTTNFNDLIFILNLISELYRCFIVPRQR